MNTWFILAVEAVLAVLAIWLLVRSVINSIRYLPGLVHTVGAMATAFFTYAMLCSPLAVDRAFITELLPCLMPCFAGLAAALAAQGWVDGRKPLPRIFQDSTVTWQDWRHRLGVSLLGWFSVEQTLEVLEDYQEQYELGREQGKAEETLLDEMGRPETVVRDLLAEDRKARLLRRKTWVWAVLAGISGWLLLGMLRSFEFGHAGFGWFYGEHAIRVCILAVVLGTVSLFFLFHARERAAVERQFSAPQKPIAWVYLLPLLATALVEWLTLWAVRDSLDYRTPVFLGAPLTMFIVLSIEFSVLLLMLLLIWTLARCVSGSIRHLAAVPCIAGSFAQITCTGIILSGMDMEASLKASAIKSVLTTLLPFAAGVLLAAVCWLILRAAGKKEG